MATFGANRSVTLKTSYVVHYPSGSSTDGGSSTTLSVGGSRVLKNNPLYRDQILRHEDASTPYSRFGLIAAKPAQHFHTFVSRNSPGLRSSQLTYWMTNMADVQTDAALSDSALKLLKSKLSTAAGAMHSMAPLAELRELRGLIRGLAHTISAKTIVDYARARAQAEKMYPLSGGRHLPSIERQLGLRRKFLADAWLQINFGLAPLLKDVSTAATAVSARINGPMATTRLVAVASKDWVSGSRYTVSTDSIGSRVMQSANAKHTLSYMYIAGFAPEKLLAGNNYSVADQFGFAWKELPGTLWELAPYSWIADYFVNVGEYLDDTFECPPGTLTYLTRTTRYTCFVQENTGSFVYGDGTTSGDVDFPGGARYLSVTREKLLSLPHIGLRLKSSDVVGAHAVSKLLNLASVYIQRK